MFGGDGGGPSHIPCAFPLFVAHVSLCRALVVLFVRVVCAACCCGGGGGGSCVCIAGKRSDKRRRRRMAEFVWRSWRRPTGQIVNKYYFHALAAGDGPIASVRERERASLCAGWCSRKNNQAYERNDAAAAANNVFACGQFLREHTHKCDALTTTTATTTKHVRTGSIDGAPPWQYIDYACIVYSLARSR